MTLSKQAVTDSWLFSHFMNEKNGRDFCKVSQEGRCEVKDRLRTASVGNMAHQDQEDVRLLCSDLSFQELIK